MSILEGIMSARHALMQHDVRIERLEVVLTRENVNILRGELRERPLMVDREQGPYSDKRSRLRPDARYVGTFGDDVDVFEVLGRHG